MKTMRRIRFAGNHIQGGAQTVLGPAGCGPDVATVEDVPALRQVVVRVTLEETDPRLPVLLGLLREHREDWLERHEDVFSEEELDNARLLVMHPNRKCEISGGVKWGMTYDFHGACPACGTGGRQTSAAFLDGEELRELEGHRAGATVFFHLLVDEGIAEQLVKIGATGVSFRSVYAVMTDKRQVKLRWKQLCADQTLPRMSPSTTGLERERACEVCGRNGYFQMTDEAPTRIVYRAADLQEIDDVNVTWENLGYAVLEPDLRDSLLSFPWTLVTPKVRRVFVEAGVTSFVWLPIQVEGEPR
jgi:hypothetical protein